MRNVPVFWAPYLKVPVSNERQSGWLFPRAGATGSNGFDISAPYYLNLAPNMDATLTPRYMSERGVLGEGSFAIARGRPENVLGAAFMPEDNQYNGQLSFDEFEERILSAEAGPGVFQTTDRWLIQAKHEGVWLPGLSTAVDFAAVSDRDYFRDLGTDLGVTSKVQLDRMAEIKPQAGGTRMRLWAEDIQLLEEGLPEAYRRLPQLDAAFRSRVLKTPLIFGYDLQYAAFDRSDAQAAEAITGTRTPHRASARAALRAELGLSAQRSGLPANELQTLESSRGAGRNTSSRPAHGKSWMRGCALSETWASGVAASSKPWSPGFTTSI